MFRGSLVGAACSVLALAAPSRAQDDGRPPFDRMERALASAVASVSRPAAMPGVGAADLCRGYRLRGVGAWFMLSPRFFPDRVVTRTRQDPQLVNADRALATAIHGLERGVDAARSEQDKET